MSTPVAILARQIVASAGSERERAVRIHQFVRNAIDYGISLAGPVTPEQVLAVGRGDALGKTILFVALLREVAIQALPHFILIDRELLHGVYPAPVQRLLPWELQHAYADVFCGGRHLRCDSYLPDQRLWQAGQGRLSAENRVLGFGVHRFGSVDWDGRRSAFAQYAAPDMLLEDHGNYQDAREYFLSARYRRGLAALNAQRPLAMQALCSARICAAQANRRLDGLRALAGYRRAAATAARRSGTLPQAAAGPVSCLPRPAADS